jgi:hypothetical protein
MTTPLAPYSPQGGSWEQEVAFQQYKAFDEELT